MFDFFKKTAEARGDNIKENIKDGTLDNVDASIIFHVTKDGKYYVDFEICDLEDDTIDNLSNLLIEVSKESFYLEMLEIVKSGFEKQDRVDCFNAIAKKITDEILNNLTSKELLYDIPNSKKKHEERPCFKPSDVL